MQLGVLGDPVRFFNLSGQNSVSRHLIVGWGQGQTTGASFAADFSTMLKVPLLSLNPGSKPSPLDIASGKADSYLIALNQALNAWGKPIYVRPMGEMNGHWNGYSAFNTDGSSRGPQYSTAAFKDAFARIYLIVHGDPQIGLHLRRLAMPAFRGTLKFNPLVKVIWNPQGFGSPDIPANSADSYYPGDRYVDVVGDDIYDIKGKAEWPAAEALYAGHTTKPFSFPEWGLWGVDDPPFIARMAEFIMTRPRTILAAYYSGGPGSVFDLATKPKSRAAYRAMIAPLGTS